MKKPLIVVSGPTATGKSSLAVRLAGDIGGEIVSADSMQVYTGMDIGTAKITKEEMRGIPHHMIDVCPPTTAYSIGDYKNEAEKRIRDIIKRGHIPILVGGTGFYIHAVLYDADFSEQGSDPSIRKCYEEMLLSDGADRLHELLRERDPVSAGMIHKNNTKRVIRALEYLDLTGTRISDHNIAMQQKESPYDFRFFVLNRSREDLYAAIDKRVDDMIAAGLCEEVQELLTSGAAPGMVSMQGIGYKEIIEYINGSISLEEAAGQIKSNTRKYSKRQVTWLKREKNTAWINAPVSEEDYRWISEQCTEISESAMR